MQRPPWAKYIHHYLTDAIIEEMPEDGEDDFLLDDIIDATNDILCGHYGHDITDDQCGKPEHRFCMWCNKRETDIAGG